ncbi:MAG: hypothetical protein QN130_12285 [Armatimonadota bacterium]|nr:hypothetical protein [Armatimonadota bacterium]
MHPGWGLVWERLGRLVAEYERRAARCDSVEHARERGRLEGVERAVAVLQEMLVELKGGADG